MQGLLWPWWLMTRAGWPGADKVWLGLEGVGIGDPGKKTGGWCIWMAWVNSGRGLGILKPLPLRTLHNHPSSIERLPLNL